MQETRDSLTEKVAALENHVVGTVQTAANTLTDTVGVVKNIVDTAPEAVTDTVKQAAEAVTDTIKDAFDLTGEVERNPWTAFGLSAGLGFLAAMVVFREHSGTASSATPERFPGPPPALEPGLFHNLFELLGSKAKEVAEAALETTAAAVKEQVREGIPKLIEPAAAMAADRISGHNGAHQYA
ncbi:MAG: DUF883 C-terminal domain-containing protein [Gemmataceae bacterium]